MPARSRETKMNFFGKQRPDQISAPSERHSASRNFHPATVTAVAKAGGNPSAPGVESQAGRQSNGLKEFLWQLDGIGHGHLLGLGPARQATITFFIDRGYKVYTEDLLATWQYFLDEEAQRAKKIPAGADRIETSPEARA